jgi:galactofuranosylgalactofuranosylrhamnosyl-N-acetylglucosaminyl-diphospho-decaprenol beta-1,5/1,6-galactofuranosyltransferase
MRGYLVDQQHSVFGQRQLVVQHAFFAAAFPETPDDLYARGTKGLIERERQRVTIAPHAQLSTNTFFGRLPTNYWQQWTDITHVEFRVIAQGAGRISIRALDGAEDVRTLATAIVKSADGKIVRLLARVDRYVNGAALWLEATTSAAELVLASACWSLAKRNEVPQPHFPHRLR